MRGALLAWGLLLAGCPGDTGGQADDDAGDPGVVDPLVSEDYAFCHEAGADADQVARWCSLLEDAPPDVCPGMRATCASGDFEAEPSLFSSGGCDGAGGDGRGDLALGPKEADDPWRPGQGCDADSGCDAPGLDGLAALFRWFIAAAVAALVLVLARQLARYLGWGTPRSAPPPVAAAVVETEEVIEGDDDLPAWSEDRLLEAAREALDAGRLGEAAIYARGAALRRLARRGLLRLHRARTDREYLRGVSDEAETRSWLQSVLGAVEDHRWAGRTLTHEAAAEAVASAARILAGLALAVLLAWPADAVAGRRHAPHGDAALYDLVAAVGWEIVDDTPSFAALDEDVDLVIIDLYAVAPDAEDWEALAAWVESGGTLVLAGGPPGPPLDRAWGDHELFQGVTADLVWDDVDDEVLDVPVWPQGPTYQYCGVPIPLVVQRPGGPTVDVGDREPCPQAVVVGGDTWGLGVVIGIADAMLLRNGAMILPANRTFLTRLPRLWGGVAPERPRVLLATATSAAQPATPVATVANARLLPFVLQLAAAWALLALAFGWPMVRRRATEDGGRHDFMEHAEALGRQWARVDAGRHAAAAHVRLLLDRHGAEGLAGKLVARGRSPAEAQALVAAAEHLVAHDEGPIGPQEHELVEALWTLRKT